MHMRNTAGVLCPHLMEENEKRKEIMRRRTSEKKTKP